MTLPLLMKWAGAAHAVRPRGAAPPFDPIFSVSGGVLDLCAQHSEVIQTSASVSSPTDISTASWTRTDCTASNATTLAVSVATNPNLMQSITNATADVPCIPLLIQFQVKFVDIAWICVESRGATAANRTWFRVDGSAAVGTNGASHAGAAISAADGDGWRTVSLRVNSNGGTAIIRIHLVTGDNVLTSPLVGTSIQLREDTTVTGWVYQNRSSSIACRVSGETFTQATAAIQPGFGVMPGQADIYDINGRPALRGTTAPGRMLSTHVGALATLNGVDKTYTMCAVVAGMTDATAAFFGTGTAAQAANGSRYWGTVLTGNGRWRHHSTSDDGTSIINSDAAADISSLASPKLLFITHDPAGGGFTLRENGAVIINGVAHDPATINADRCAIFCHPTSAQGNRLNGRIGTIKLWNRVVTALERAAIEADVAAEWGITL